MTIPSNIKLEVFTLKNWVSKYLDLDYKKIYSSHFILDYVHVKMMCALVHTVQFFIVVSSFQNDLFLQLSF